MEHQDFFPTSFQDVIVIKQGKEQSRMQIIKMAPKIPTSTSIPTLTKKDNDNNNLQKRDPLAGVFQNGANKISSAANAWYTTIANMGNNNGGTSGGSGSSGGSSSDKGSSSSGSNSGSNNSGGSSGGSNSGGSSSSSGGSSNSGSNSSGSNSGSNNSGSSSHNSGSSGSSSGNTSSGSGSSGNNNNNDSGSENNNSNQSHNSGSSSSSNDSSSNSNQNSGTAEKSTSNNDSNGSTPATPVTLSNGAVVTPIAIVDQSSTGLNGLGTNTASQSILVVMTNSQGEKVTSTLAYDSSIAAIAASATNSPTIKDQTNTGTNEIKNLNGTTKSSSTNVGMIAGPVIAVLICAIGALTLFFCLRRKRRARTSISSYGNTTPSRSLRRFIPTFRSPRFGAIRLPSLPSFNLHNTSPTSPEMVQPFNTVISRPSSGLVSPMDYVGRKRVSPNDIQEANRMSSNGLQITGINNSPRNSDRSISVPESVYFSPSQTHHPRLNSINDAINSGELTYDDDASSIGHESQGVGYAGSESAERRSYASTMLFSRAIGHSESHKALSSMVNLDEGQDPFSSPIQDNRKSFEIIQSENSPKSFQSSFQANESVMSRDTFGIPSSPMSERSDSNYGFANPGIPSTLSAQIGNKALLSPFRNLLGRSDVQTFSSFTSIVEEENDSQKGIPDQIKNDLERKRQLSIFRRGDQ